MEGEWNDTDVVATTSSMCNTAANWSKQSLTAAEKDLHMSVHDACLCKPARGQTGGREGGVWG